MRLVSEENGISPMRRCCFSSSSFHKPAFAAVTINAPSVGSPLMIHLSDSGSFSRPLSERSFRLWSLCLSCLNRLRLCIPRFQPLEASSQSYSLLPSGTCRQQERLSQWPAKLLGRPQQQD